MLNIRKEQVEVFEGEQAQIYIEQTLVKIKKTRVEWCSDKTDDEIRSFIQSMIELAEDHDIHEGLSISHLMSDKMQYDYQIPLTPSLAARLKRPKEAEAVRIESFHHLLESRAENLILLDLSEV